MLAEQNRDAALAGALNKANILQLPACKVQRRLTRTSKREREVLAKKGLIFSGLLILPFRCLTSSLGI